MRMRYMYFVAKTHYDTIKEARPVEKKDSNHALMHYTVGNWTDVVIALENVSVIPGIGKKVEEFFALQVGMRWREKTLETIPKELHQKYIGLHKEISMKLEAIIDFCEAAGFDSSASGFDVKMPETSNFSEFSKYVEDLNFVLSQCPYLINKDERIELKKTDSGTIWFEFFVITSGSAVLLYNLAKLVDKSVKIRSHVITTRQQREMLRTMELKNEVLESHAKVIDKLEEAFLDRVLGELKEELGATNNGEDDTRVIKSLRVLSELMDKGMQIVSSIGSSPEIKDLFPASDEISFLPSPQKLLSEKK